jgi:hypothetical protein
MVFAFLRIYIPKAQPQCPADVSLIVQSYNCTGNNLNLTISNRGLWKVDAAYVRLGTPGQEVKKLISSEVNYGQYLNYPRGLMPTNTTTKVYRLGGLNNLQLNMEVQITPAIRSEEKTGALTLCENAIITQPIRCDIN